MRPRCLPPPLCLVLLLLLPLLISRVPESACLLQEYVDCRNPSSFRCGEEEFNVSYPFLADKRKGHCGIGEHYNLSCEGGGTPVIDIGGRPYRVRRIDYAAGVLGIADLAASRNRACPLAPYESATLDWSFFEYTGDDLHITLYSNCTPVSSDPLIPNLYEVPCLAFGDKKSYVVNLEAPPTDPFVLDSLRPSCASTAVVPLGGTAARSLNLSDAGSLQRAMEEGFNLTWTSGNNSWCGECISSGGACGYYSSNETHICFCSDKASARSCPTPAKENNKPRKIAIENNKPRKIAIGVGAGVGGFFLACLLCFLVYRRKRMRARTGSSTLLFRTASSEPPSHKDPEVGSTHYYSTHVFKYEELSEATDGFSEANELGDGGFGTVYKGKLRDGRIVAVKRLYENNYKRVEQFMNEVAILNRLQHPNLVTLYGCTSRHSRELLLVYEYVPNGTVADHLHGDRAVAEGWPPLGWPVRLSIAVETATALAYLHKVEPPIIHRDVKTNNILLDDNFHVKVADFGLSRLFPTDATHVSTAPQGTPGYVDPEYHQCYQLTDKSDVYSFGVVLAELISSKPAVDITRHRHDINLANMAVSKIQSGELRELVDPALEFETDPAARRMIELVAELAFRCLQAEKEMRPCMEHVAEVLRGIRESSPQPDEAAYDGLQREGDTDHGDDASLLKNNKNAPFSPDSVMDKWASRTTTPKTSV